MARRTRTRSPSSTPRWIRRDSPTRRKQAGDNEFGPENGPDDRFRIAVHARSVAHRWLSRLFPRHAPHAARDTAAQVTNADLHAPPPAWFIAGRWLSSQWSAPLEVDTFGWKD